MGAVATFQRTDSFRQHEDQAGEQSDSEPFGKDRFPGRVDRASRRWPRDEHKLGLRDPDRRAGDALHRYRGGNTRKGQGDESSDELCAVP